MFVLVEASQLCPEKKYKIIADTEYTGVYRGEFWRDDNVLIFSDVYGFRSNGYPHYFKKSRQFYQFVSQKARIQSDMEQRALNLILRNLLGDYFNW